MVDYKNKDIGRMRVIYRMARFILNNYNLDVPQIRQHNRCRDISEPRMIAMYILRNKGFHPSEVALLFRRDHSTVCKNYERMKGLIRVSPQDYKRALELEEEIDLKAPELDWNSVSDVKTHQS